LRERETWYLAAGTKVEQRGETGRRRRHVKRKIKSDKIVFY
jgi:hypothetical protein